MLSGGMADGPRKELSVRIEDLYRILSSEELTAFGLAPMSATQMSRTPIHEDRAHFFPEAPTAELSPAA